MTQYAVQTAKVASTPTVKLDGRVLGTNETFTVNGLRKAILAAAAREQSTPAPAGS
jgi:hypothetical protein